jgi:FtsZ-binding cell division protein ZapB
MSRDVMGGGTDEQGASTTDGGGPVTAGSDPPLPADPIDLLESHGPDDRAGGDCHAIRVSLGTDSDRYARRIVEELEEEVDVLGATHEDGGGPTGCFDVLVAMDYAPSTVAEALVEPADVTGATIVAVPAERPREEAGDGDAADGGPEVPATASSDETGNHPTFEQFKLETDPIGYDDLVDKLESTSLPGEFDTGVDLQPIMEGDDDGGDGAATTDTASPTGDATATTDTASPTGDGAATTDTASPTGDATAADGDLDVPAVGDAEGDGAAGSATHEGAAVPGAGADPDPEAVVEALVDAIEADAVTDEQRRTLVDALADDDPPKTLLVKLEHLQREVDELAAYKESLEAFIDEYGSGEGLVDEVRATMQQFAADVNDLSREVDRLGDALAATEDRLDGVDDRLGDLDAVAATVEDHESRLAAVDDLASDVDDIDEFDARLGTLEADLEELQATATAGGDVEARLAAVEDDVSDLGDRVGSLASETARRVDDAEERLDDVEERLAEQEAWQERFQALLSSAGTPTGGDGPPG